jgi:hypothetical protein
LRQAGIYLVAFARLTRVEARIAVVVIARIFSPDHYCPANGDRVAGKVLDC